MDVIAVFGSTASGKSAAALELAGRLGGEIVNCDAMQLYRGLPILTNQPTADEQRLVAHHLVGIWPLEHQGSVAEYAELARSAIDAIVARGRPAIVVGGSGLYLRAALGPLQLPPRPASGSRQRWTALYDRLGAEQAHARLAAVDPAAAAAVHPNDRRRVVRALELAEQGASLAPRESELWSVRPRHRTRLFGLDTDPQVVRERIAVRTRQMFERGVEQEVRRVLDRHDVSTTAARIHGLQDVTALIRGSIDRAQAERLLVTRTRRYAKRQRVWMRRLPGLEPVSGCPAMLDLL